MILFSLFTLSLSLNSFAEVSAYRDPETPAEIYEDQIRREKSRDFSGSALGSARYFTDGVSLPAAKAWESVEALQNRFKSVRDDRHLNWTRRPGFSRRISWLYPNDGCYARASSANRWFKRHGISTPSKVFAFGKLRVKTRNHPRGVATWWYHVAPVVQVGGTKYVIDPSIDASKALTITEWVTRMGTPGRIRVSICGSGTHSPRSDCSSQNVGSAGVSSQAKFLGREWDQLKRMGRNSELLLGSNPPW